MPENKKNRRQKNIFKWTGAVVLLLFPIFFLVLYRDPGPKRSANQDLLDAMSRRNNNRSNHILVDSAISLLRSGDLVMRRGIDVTSFMLSQMNLIDKTYSHCGLVMIENGYPFVYHSIGGEDNPNARLRRDSACFFFSPANNLSFGLARYDLEKNEIDSLGHTVREFYKEHKMFDMKFDLKTDDRFYCSEFVYKALRKVKDSAYIKPVSVMGFQYIGIDNLYQNRHAKLVWQVKFK